MKRVMASLTIGACLLLPSAGAVFAAGQPGAPAVTCFTSPQTALAPSQAPSGASGAAVSARGSVFNPNGVAGTVYAGNPGTASLANANSPNAVSQYDVACLQITTQVP
jgi:hypothetical protein